MDLTTVALVLSIVAVAGVILIVFGLCRAAGAAARAEEKLALVDLETGHADEKFGPLPMSVEDVVDSLLHRVSNLERDLREANGRETVAREVAQATSLELRQIKSELDLMRESTGGLWRTADGTLVQIRQMSDNHLNNCLSLGYARSAEIRHLMEAEQRRRATDRRFRERDGETSGVTSAAIRKALREIL